MEFLGFEGRGAQARFAERIGVDRRRLNNVLVGYPLSPQFAQIIIRRYPRISAEFLILGKCGTALDRDLERQFSEYQRRREQKARRHEYYCKRRANLTPEQLDAERAYQREYARKRRATMTPERIEAHKAYQRDHQREQRASMTPEELKAQNVRRRDY